MAVDTAPAPAPVPAPIQVMVRGAGLMSTSRWIRETYGEATFKELVRSLPPAAAEALASPRPTEWYPAPLVSEIYLAIRETAHPGDPRGFERALRDLGHFLAKDNLSAVFRVLVAFTPSPEEMFRKIGQFWAQYWQGVRVENDVSDLAAGRGVTRVYGLGDVQYLAPVACGWTEVGFQKVGAKHVRVRERAFAEGETAADPLVFEVSWGSHLPSSS